jgi:hypothetical protein
MINTSRIMPVLKVETDIITSIAASLIGTYVILVIIYVEPYKTIDNIIMGLMSHRSIMISIRVSWLILQISKANARITDNNSYLINTSKSNRRYISTPPFFLNIGRKILQIMPHMGQAYFQFDRHTNSVPFHHF